MPVHYDPRMTFDEGLELAKCVPEVKALVEVCHWWLETGRFLAGNSPRKAAGVLRTDAALAPFTEAPDAMP